MSDIATGSEIRKPDPEELGALAELFHQMSDTTRLGLLISLLGEETCVCELADKSDVSVSAVSHQLRSLRTARLVTGKREGRHIYYSLADDHVRVLVSIGLEHVRE